MKAWLRKHIQGGMTDDEYQAWKEDLLACVSGFVALMLIVWAWTL